MFSAGSSHFKLQYHLSCEPLRIFWNYDTTCSTCVPCVLPTPGWIPGFSACSGQHAWHSCRAGCIFISENPQGLATHMVRWNYQSWLEVRPSYSTFSSPEIIQCEGFLKWRFLFSSLVKRRENVGVSVPCEWFTETNQINSSILKENN